MSRIGKQPIVIPQGVKALIAGQLIKIEGPKGKLERQMRPEIKVREENGQLILERKDDSKTCRAFHGMERSLVNNMVQGVFQGYSKELALVGVGYRAEISGNTLTFALGYSHPIEYPLPAGVSGSLLKEGREVFVKLESIDKQLLGAVAAEIRGFRSPEPYKGKGVRYRDEVVRSKAGKTGKV